MSDADDTADFLRSQAHFYRQHNGLPDDAPLSLRVPGRAMMTASGTITLDQAEELFDLIEQNPWRFPDMPKSRLRRFLDRFLWWP